MKRAKKLKGQKGLDCVLRAEDGQLYAVDVDHALESDSVVIRLHTCEVEANGERVMGPGCVCVSEHTIYFDDVSVDDFDAYVQDLILESGTRMERRRGVLAKLKKVREYEDVPTVTPYYKRFVRIDRTSGETISDEIEETIR